MSLMGLDIGTTGCKAIAFRTDGGIAARASREYPVFTPRPDWAEQDAEQVWTLSMETVREAAAAAGGDVPASLALSVQGEAVTPVDSGGRALRRTILGMDTRTDAQNRWLAGAFGAGALFERTGMPVHTVNTLPKLLWLKENEPAIWKSASRFLLYEDFFIRRLCGEPVISHCLASRTQMYNLGRGTWDEELLAACGIDPSRLARLAAPGGGVVGTVRTEIARAAGIPAGIPVASGGHDQACAALGSGVSRPGLAMVSTGTAEVVEVAMAEPVLNETLRNGNISIYNHVVPGLFVAMTLNQSGGLLLRWFRDGFAQYEMEQAKTTGADAYDLILKDAGRQPTNLFVLPHFSGSGTPWFDTRSRGAILGLNLTTRKADVAKALLEGLTFDLRVNLDLLRDAGIHLSEIHAVGGGAKSRLWLQLKADICGIPLRVPKVTEAACLGAAILGGTAAGMFKNVAEGLDRMLAFQEKRIEPGPEAQAYTGKYEKYRVVYPMLREFNRSL